jgi:hypothetical protein
MLQSAIRMTILAANVDVTFIRADGVARNCHRFEHDMRVAFKHDAVFERAWFAFIGIADDIFLVALRRADKFPLAPGRGSPRRRVPASLISQHINDLIWRHFGQAFPSAS